MKAKNKYIPAMGLFELSRWYDPLVRLLMNEARLKGQLIENAHIPPAGRVLDVGCGSGTLLLMVERAMPEARLHGLDGDEGILKIPSGKIRKSGIMVEAELNHHFDLTIN